ncbi:DNA binding domain-containing protein, excisionase family [Friedmanniella luteola]|uniref:DNA binding domain-containing protein, excisionase family n=1 Tax=Friedmanniella luteola TaxID=546871 RepID=A0A1H1QDX9_9ACTN|nr:hypothetical protein [Friedmanniella luteola]SDS21584.1 DNA binding domain-containing protein, excisionase family [Friedmanniella luteola]
MSDRRLDSIQAAAEAAKVSPITIRRRIASGDLAAYRFGPRIIRVDLNQVDALFTQIPTGGNAA